MKALNSSLEKLPDQEPSRLTHVLDIALVGSPQGLALLSFEQSHGFQSPMSTFYVSFQENKSYPSVQSVQSLMLTIEMKPLKKTGF